MAIESITSSKQFLKEILESTGSVMVVFPGTGSLISDFVMQQVEVVASWRPDLKVFSYKPKLETDDDGNQGTLIALYSEGVFLGATSRYCFAEYLDAWYETTLQEFERLGEMQEYPDSDWQSSE